MKWFLFLLVLSVYVLSSPGRIDIIDGEYRYEVARNWLHEGRPVLHDPNLRGAPGIDGRYAYYGPAASVAGMPLVWLAGADEERARFFFSFTTPIFAALTMLLLFLFYELLGVSQRRAAGFTLLVAFTTLVWPLGTSSFDQMQQAFFVLLSVYAAIKSARQTSFYWALGAGLAAGVVLLYQETYIVLLPSLALFLFGKLDRKMVRDARLWGFFLAASLGVAAFCEFNLVRFGSPFTTGKGIVGHPLAGNPGIGALGLLLSPGKSLFLYSPPTVLALWGLRALWRQQPYIARSVVAVLLCHFALISSLAFYGGDWCWGPRYLGVMLPLGAVGLPFLTVDGRLRRILVAGVFAVGLVVQLLALSMDHQRFFFARGLRDFFWTDQAFYFEHSALWDRLAELGTIGRPPTEAQTFLPSPLPGSVTYSIFGTPPGERSRSATWMRQFRVFYRPRPWPLWMPFEPGVPIHPRREMLVLSALALIGAAGTARGFRRRTSG